MSACDMFDYEYDTETCSMLPYMSLKNERWETVTMKTSTKAAVFVLFCSTALENIAVGSDFNARSTEPGNWEFSGWINKSSNLPEVVEISSVSNFRGTPTVYIRVTPWRITDGMIEALEADLETRCEKDGLAFAAVMLTDITTAQTRVLYKGEWAEKLVKHEQDGVLMMENTLSRKKQGWPWLQGELA